MIVRILGEGQYAIDSGERNVLDALDSALMDAVDSGDEPGFATALDALIAEVRRVGRPGGRRRLRALRPGRPVLRLHAGRDQGPAGRARWRRRQRRPLTGSR